MDRTHIVHGRHAPEKRARAKELRREMTPAEAALWQRLRTGRLNGWHFRRQQVIDGFIVDFYCHAAGLVIELDGPIHLARAGYDAERSRLIEARGLRVLRFPNERVLEQIEGVLEDILRSLEHPDSPGIPRPPRPTEEGATTTDPLPSHPLPPRGRGPGG